MIFDDIVLMMRRCLGHNTKWTHGYGLVVVVCTCRCLFYIVCCVVFTLFVAIRWTRMKWMVDLMIVVAVYGALMHCAGTIDCGLMALVECLRFG